ncbi:MAG: inorganic diphosphatase [Candidatus Poribacteria bacterium]|nr:inorganic diphosphatase [Candidatus Poribacteria bacterium]
MNLQDIPLGRHAPSIINVVIEAPKGSRKKYRYHAKSRRFRLAYECSMPVPTEYGWIPETTAEDGHFLNAMVVARHSTHPGYICEARPIGILKRKDNDHHVICVSLSDERYAAVQDIFELDVKLLKKIVQFFEPYFELCGWLNHQEASEMIKVAHEKYRARQKTPIARAQTQEMPKDDVTSKSSDETAEAPEVEENADWDDEDDSGEEEDAGSDD